MDGEWHQVENKRGRRQQRQPSRSHKANLGHDPPPLQCCFQGELVLQVKVRACQELTKSSFKGNLEDGTPITKFSLDMKFYEQLKKFKENGHPYRLRVHQLAEDQEQPGKLVVVTEELDEKLGDWLPRQNLIRNGKLNMESFSKILRPLVNTVIATRDLCGDFDFNHANIYVCTRGEKPVFKILHIKNAVDKSDQIMCMAGLAKVVDRWLNEQLNDKSKIPDDVNLFLWMIEKLDPEKFPLNTRKLLIILESPIFYCEDKNGFLDFIISLEWWLQGTDSWEIGCDVADALHYLGDKNVDYRSGWLKISMLKGDVKRCVKDAPTYPRNDMGHLLRGFRGIIFHFKEKEKKYDIEPDNLYDQLEQMLPGGWASLHYAAVETEEVIMAL